MFLFLEVSFADKVDMDAINHNNSLFSVPNTANGTSGGESITNGKKVSYNNNSDYINTFPSHSRQNQNFQNRNFLRGRGRGRFVLNRASHSSCFAKDKKSNENCFIYGNYHYYYGYRNHDGPDVRLSCLKREWLLQKDVLDIGCNAGHFTLSVARDFSPRMIIGIDIDPYLVRTARKNAKHYLLFDDYTSEFPISCLTQYGPMTLSLLPGFEDSKFPYNVGFVQGNYVLKSDELLEFEQPKFDTIFCLSVTKWIQLNWGDDGLKRTFMRMYAQLRNGGYLILEAQPYSSYKNKKSKATETMVRNFQNMQLLPEQFNEYLVNVIGFKSCELIDVPTHSSKGFSRPLYLFTKGMDYRYAAPKHIIFESQDQSDLTDVSDLDMEELSD